MMKISSSPKDLTALLSSVYLTLGEEKNVLGN